MKTKEEEQYLLKQNQALYGLYIPLAILGSMKSILSQKFGDRALLGIEFLDYDKAGFFISKLTILSDPRARGYDLVSGIRGAILFPKGLELYREFQTAQKAEGQI